MRESTGVVCGVLLLVGAGCTLHSGDGEVDAARPDAAVMVDAAMVVGPDAAAASCNVPVACTPPSGLGGDEICISGRVYNAVDATPIVDGVELMQFEVRLYEPLNLFADPSIQPFRRIDLRSGLDTCGRFLTRFSVTQDTPNGLLAVAVGGRAGAAGLVLGVTLVRPVANMNLVDRAAIRVTEAQDLMWSMQAGLPPPMTFAGLGTVAVRYHRLVSGPFARPNPGIAIASVVPQWNGMTDPARDFFFPGATLNPISSSATLPAHTGQNGVAFLTPGRGLGNVGAVQGAPDTCAGPPGANTLTVTGPTLVGTTTGAIVFFDLEATCR